MAFSVDIPEHFIRHIWQHQLFTVENLRTPDGRPVIILSPGKANYDGGPDFKDARIRINQITYYGDVELHRDAASWRSHSHDTNPHYNKVILHVVMTADPLLPPAYTVSRRAVPLLVLHPFLDSRLQIAWEQILLNPDHARSAPLKCATASGKVPVERLANWLNHLASDRLELKVRRFQERLRQLADERTLTVREPYPRYYGDPDQIPAPHKEYSQHDFASKELWEQLLYEGIMECLGYAKNRKPFVALARSMTLAKLKRYQLDDTGTMMALLFGVAGLLPSSRGLPEKESRDYVRKLRAAMEDVAPSISYTGASRGRLAFLSPQAGKFPDGTTCGALLRSPGAIYCGWIQESDRDLQQGRIITCSKKEGIAEYVRLPAGSLLGASLPLPRLCRKMGSITGRRTR